MTEMPAASPQARRSIVITSINYPTDSIRRMAELNRHWDIVVVADQKTPKDWHLDGVTCLTLELQQELAGRFTRRCPMNHYARKNIGYLWAMRLGAEVIVDTDDDNTPYEHFLQKIERSVGGRPALNWGWENVYRHFTTEHIWPRGFPLEEIRGSFAKEPALGDEGTFSCPVQQFLADGDPDVDAIYRLTLGRPTEFRGRPVVLSAWTYCPFNSQNTVWWREAFPLMYLPSYSTFRMTDIWRSFVAQICLYRIGEAIAFHGASVFQIRNAHRLLTDFAEELPGYLNNSQIIDWLASADLSPNPDHMMSNLRRCYEVLVARGVLPETELQLLDDWTMDVVALKSR
jgi:hypothetical protein